LRLNLGCGKDYKEGYINVDFSKDVTVDECVDLYSVPWPWKDGSADEILMLDFLEHLPYRKTETILLECFRVLRDDGLIVIQVPDFDHCSRAALDRDQYKCNACGFPFVDGNKLLKCGKCGQSKEDITKAAIHRLYGGQDYHGNWHYTAFTQEILSKMLLKSGFKGLSFLEEKHQWDNWNFKISGRKNHDIWEL